MKNRILEVEFTPSTLLKLFLILFLFGFAISLLRDPTNITHPSLRIEDGSHLFGYYFSDPNPFGILKNYGGYISFLPNLISYLIVLLPVKISPYLFGSIPLVFTAFTFSLFILPSFRQIVKSDTIRLVICLFFIILPYGNFALQGTLVAMIFHILFILTLLSLITPNTRGWKLTLLFIALASLICSHPFSIALLPIFIFKLYENRSEKSLISYYSALIFTILLYYSFGLDHSSDSNYYSLNHIFSKSLLFLRYFLDRTIFNLFFPNRIRIYMLNNELFQHLVIPISIFGILIIAALIYRNWDETKKFIQPKTILYLVYLIVIFSLFRFISNRSDPQLTNYWGQRYFYLQKLYLVIILTPFLAVSLAKSNNAWRAFMACGIIALISFNNSISNRRYHQDLEKAEQIQQMITEISRQEAQNNGRHNIKTTIIRDHFPIIINRK